MNYADIPLAYAVLRVIWWVLLGTLLIGFTLTDGFDLGVAALLPFVARSDGERRMVINTVGPTWEGNQVWFILGGGAIFAAWPTLYAASFSGFYLAMILVLATLILRPAGFKFRSKLENTRWRSFPQAACCAAHAVLAARGQWVTNEKTLLTRAGLRPVDEFIGWFNLMPMPGRDGEIELGARLLPRAWGVSLADEGGEALLRHAFETLGRERVWAVFHVRHEAVRSCVLALGFRDAGVLPYEGEPARHFLITRDDWQASQALPRRARLRRAIADLRNLAAVA